MVLQFDRNVDMHVQMRFTAECTIARTFFESFWRSVWLKLCQITCGGIRAEFLVSFSGGLTPPR